VKKHLLFPFKLKFFLETFFLKIFFLFFIFLPFPIFSQPINQDVPEIKWIGEISRQTIANKNLSFFKNLKNLIFGKSQENISHPFSIFKEDGLLWILDQGLKEPVVYDFKVGHITHLKAKSLLPFNSLIDICNGPNDKLLFTDSEKNTIFEIDKSTLEVKPLNKELKLNRPTGIAYFKKNNTLWVVETGEHRIQVLDSTGVPIKVIGRRGTEPGEFNYPTAIWIDKFGTIYVIDTMNFRVQILNADGEVIFVFGEIGDATGYFARPKDIATDSKGNIYVVDAIFHTVQIFDRQGNFLYNFGEQGKEPGQFWLPGGIFIDEGDRIYIADSYNGRVQIFQLKWGQK